MPVANADLTFVLPWNDAAALEAVFAAHGPDIAAVVMEPVNHDSGTILPVDGYLQAARDLTRRHGAVLIFDEVLSRVPDAGRRGPGAVRRHPRHDDARQDPRRRDRAECLRRQPRRDVGRVARSGGPSTAGPTTPTSSRSWPASRSSTQATDPAFYPHLREPGGRVLPGAPGRLRSRRRPRPRPGDGRPVQPAVRSRSAARPVSRHPRRRHARRRPGSTASPSRKASTSTSAWHHGFSAMHTTRDLEVALDGIERAARRLAARAPRRRARR